MVIGVPSSPKNVSSVANLVSCSKPINILAPAVPDVFFADVSALSRNTPPALVVEDRSTNSAEHDDVAFVAHLANWYDGSSWERHVDALSCAQAYRRVARSSGRSEFHSKSAAFSSQAVGQALLAYRCRSSSVDLEIVGTGFVLRHGVHPLRRIIWHSLIVTSLYTVRQKNISELIPPARKIEFGSCK